MSKIAYLTDPFPVQLKVGEKRIGIICNSEIVGN